MITINEVKQHVNNNVYDDNHVKALFADDFFLVRLHETAHAVIHESLNHDSKWVIRMQPDYKNNRIAKTEYITAGNNEDNYNNGMHVTLAGYVIERMIGISYINAYRSAHDDYIKFNKYMKRYYTGITMKQYNDIKNSIITDDMRIISDNLDRIMMITDMLHDSHVLTSDDCM